MDIRLSKTIQRALQKELVRRQLIEYFSKKGAKAPYDKLIYPPSILDLPTTIKELYNKIEIIPYADSIDPDSGIIRVNWNMFILGHHRIDLGKTTHTSLQELQQVAQGGSDPNLMLSESKHTAREIITRILELLEQSESGFEPLPAGVELPTNINPFSSNRLSNYGRTAGFFDRRKGR